MKRKKVEVAVDEELTGRDLDAAIAVKLFGWRWFLDPRKNFIALWPPDDGVQERWNFASDYVDVTGRESAHERFTDWARVGPLPGYSSDWNAMWLVVEEMQAKGFGCRTEVALGKCGECYCEASFHRPFGTDCFTSSSWSTLPPAVCHAALKALEANDAE